MVSSMVDSRPKEKPDYKVFFITFFIMFAILLYSQCSSYFSNEKMFVCGKVVEKYRAGRSSFERNVFVLEKDNQKYHFLGNIIMGKSLANPNTEKMRNILTNLKIGDRLCITYSPTQTEEGYPYIFDIQTM